MLIECSHPGNAYSNDKRCSLVISEPERKKKIEHNGSYLLSEKRAREKKELALFFFITVHPSMIEGICIV